LAPQVNGRQIAKLRPIGHAEFKRNHYFMELFMRQPKQFKSPFMKKYRALNWQDTDDENMIRALKPIPEEFMRNEFKSEADVIQDWADFSRTAFLNTGTSESSIPLWDFHHIQFGRIMLQLANMLYYKKDYRGQLSPYHQISNEHFDMNGSLIFEGAISSEDRKFYRIWYTLLGHPDYHNYLNLSNYNETHIFNWTYLVVEAFKDFECSLRN